MSKFANFVHGRLASSLSDTATEAIRVLPVMGDMPNPAGQRAYLLLVDDPRRPTVFELIAYSGTAPGPGGSMTLLHVERGALGTGAEEWPAQTDVYQDLPAHMALATAASGSAGQALKYGDGGLLEYGDVDWFELSMKPTSQSLISFNVLAMGNQPAAQAGAVVLYVRNNTFGPGLQTAARFPNGTISVIEDNKSLDDKP